MPKRLEYSEDLPGLSFVFRVQGIRVDLPGNCLGGRERRRTRGWTDSFSGKYALWMGVLGANVNDILGR